MDYRETSDFTFELSDHWNKTEGGNMYKLLDTIVGPMSTLFNQEDKISEERAISTASGQILTLMGKDRSINRNTNDDELFRFLVYLKALLGQADGTFPKIAEIADTALNSTEEVKIIKTGVHHISVSLPLDVFKDSDAQKTVIKNVSQLTALGIWLDNFIFENEDGKKIIIAANKIIRKSIITTAKL